MLIDTYHERWLDRLSAPVDGAPAGSSTFLLIDGVFVPGLYRMVNKVLPSPQVTTLLFEALPGCSDKTRDVSPFIASYHT